MDAPSLVRKMHDYVQKPQKSRLTNQEPPTTFNDSERRYAFKMLLSSSHKYAILSPEDYKNIRRYRNLSAISFMAYGFLAVGTYYIPQVGGAFKILGNTRNLVMIGCIPFGVLFLHIYKEKKWDKAMYEKYGKKYSDTRLMELLIQTNSIIKMFRPSYIAKSSTNSYKQVHNRIKEEEIARIGLEKIPVPQRERDEMLEGNNIFDSTTFCNIYYDGDDKLN